MNKIMKLWFLLSLNLLVAFLGWLMTRLGSIWGEFVLYIGGATLLVMIIFKIRMRRKYANFASFALVASLLLGTIAGVCNVGNINEWMGGSWTYLKIMIHPIEVFDAKTGPMPLSTAKRVELENVYAQLHVYDHSVAQKILVAFDNFGLAIIDHQNVIPITDEVIIPSVVLPDNSIIYYNRSGEPQTLTRARIQGNELIRMWEEEVPNLTVQHWGDAWQGKLYQPARSFFNLPSPLWSDVYPAFQKCRMTNAVDEMIRIFDINTGKYEREIRLLPIIAALEQEPGVPKLIHPSCQREIFHLNAVEVIKTQHQADEFPNGKIGDMLVSMKNINTIALLDRDTFQVKWHVENLFKLQHDPTITDWGTVIVFDNFGSNAANGQSRVVEISIATRKVIGEYEATGQEYFQSDVRGRIILTDMPHKIIVSEEHTDHKDSMFVLDCGDGPVSNSCKKTWIFQGSGHRFDFMFSALLPEN